MSGDGSEPVARRTVVVAGLLAPALAAALAAPPPAAGAVPLDRLGVRPRRDWAQDRPAGRLLPETDVRFLLVHHTATGNDYSADEVAAVLERVRTFHTGPEKGWPDVAYNFFVDRFGGIWEGREGSLAGPVRADATGGNQGFAQLCCFLGDHTASAPTPAARASMAALLAALADRHDLDLSPGTTATFVSRGSNRWPAGRSVTVRTVAGHRDVSRSECPGDAAYALIERALPEAATAARGPSSATARPSGAPAPPAVGQVAPAPADPTSNADAGATVGIVAGLGALAAAGLVALRRRRG